MAMQLTLPPAFACTGTSCPSLVGKPAIYITYDSRTRELVEHFGIPALDIMENRPFRMEEFLAPGTFDKFNVRAKVAYGLMRDFLDRNQVAHRMIPTIMPEQVRSAA